MTNSSNRRSTSGSVNLIHIEALTTLVLVLAIITLVAGRFPHSLQKSPILTVRGNFPNSFLYSRVRSSSTPYRSKPSWPTKASRIKATSQTGTSFITSRSARACGSLPAHISRTKPPKSARRWRGATSSHCQSCWQLMPVSLSTVLSSRLGRSLSSTRRCLLSVWQSPSHSPA
jgi:hypothetical protein